MFFLRLNFVYFLQARKMGEIFKMQRILGLILINLTGSVASPISFSPSFIKETHASQAAPGR